MMENKNGKNRDSIMTLISQMGTPLVQRDFNDMEFQMDFINSKVSVRPGLVDYLNENSSRLQHLLDENPSLMRWWFDDLSKALSVMKEVLERFDGFEVSHRPVCLEKNVLLLQVGDI